MCKLISRCFNLLPCWCSNRTLFRKRLQYFHLQVVIVLYSWRHCLTARSSPELCIMVWQMHNIWILLARILTAYRISLLGDYAGYYAYWRIAASALNDVSPEAVTWGDLSAIRRLMLDAQTLSVAMVKQAVEGHDGQTKSELSPPERSHRIADQKTRLTGISFSGPYECLFPGTTLWVRWWRRILHHTPSHIRLGLDQQRCLARNHQRSLW